VSDEGDVTGRRVLVTGASSGIGAATCRALVARGASVAMVARRKERLDQLAEELGPGAVPAPADVTDLGALEAAIGEAAERLGGLDTVVTAAGQMMTGEMMSGTPERWRQLMELNLIGPLASVRYAVQHFPEHGRRDVVIVGSTGALTPMRGVGIYAATKRGLEAAFDTLRLELAHRGVNVGLVMPGMFDTEGLTMEGLVFDGDIPDVDVPYFVADGVPAAPGPLADCIVYMIGRPEGICIHEIVVRPTGQLNP
jgi:NADP-dependent 3-hydroxy acid dehydrogenase YdfG